MKVHILGSCSGTEPISGRHHTAWILETGSRLYQFDAGENCAYRAHTDGLALCRLRALFITHGHLDHVGGLPHLLWTIRKIISKGWDSQDVNPMPVYLPRKQLLQNVLDFLGYSEFPEYHDVEPHRIEDGPLFDDGSVTIEAFHNKHAGIPADGRWLSFSYRIRCEKHVIIDSGDLDSWEELIPMLDIPCDLLLMESGHHHPWEVAASLAKLPEPPRFLLFKHHGRDILDRCEETLAKTRQVWPEKSFLFAEDGMTFSL